MPGLDCDLGCDPVGRLEAEWEAEVVQKGADPADFAKAFFAKCQAEAFEEVFCRIH